jgi:hypothetical protein
MEPGEIPGTSRKSTAARVLFFGEYSAASQSRRASGTSLRPRWISARPEPNRPVSTLPWVSALKIGGFPGSGKADEADFHAVPRERNGDHTVGAEDRARRELLSG